MAVQKDIYQIYHLCDNCGEEKTVRVEVGKENEGREYKNVTEGKRAPTKADDESQPD